MNNPSVSIVIVNWNGLTHLKTLLPSLKKLTYQPLEVIVVDNASTDQSVDFIRRYFPTIKIVINTINEGFAQGNNIGVARARGEYILLLNNDTLIIQPDMVERLLKKIQSFSKIGIVQPKILRMNHKHILDSVGAYYTRTGFLYHFGYLQYDEKKYNKSIALYTAKGACMLIRSDLIKKIGLFDPRYFAYFEETDFCHRAWLAGSEVWYEPAAKIEHHIGGTSNAMDNAYVQFHSFKNRIHSYLKNLGTKELLLLLPVHLVLSCSAAIMFLLKGKPGLFFAIFKALWWNIMMVSSTLNDRNIIQSQLRVQTDSAFLPQLTNRPPIAYYLALFGNRLETYEAP